MNRVSEIKRITLLELNSNIIGGITKGSWHEKYSNSAWIFIGGLSNELSEGDIICVMSQWGEIEDINLVRDKITGKNKGYCFIKYYNQKCCILAVDNVNGMDLLGRILHCDHVDQYKLPKEVQEAEDKATTLNFNVPSSA